VKILMTRPLRQTSNWHLSLLLDTTLASLIGGLLVIEPGKNLATDKGPSCPLLSSSTSNMVVILAASDSRPDNASGRDSATDDMLKVKGGVLVGRPGPGLAGRWGKVYDVEWGGEGCCERWGTRGMRSTGNNEGLWQ
jgi:hypothetical protein